MAAGFARVYGGDACAVYSAGSEPADSVNAAAVEAMTEVGIDITGAVPQRWSTELLAAVDVVITMGCGDSCPVYPGKRYIEWTLDDPRGLTVEAIRPIRDTIAARVRDLLTELDVSRQD